MKAKVRNGLVTTVILLGKGIMIQRNIIGSPRDVYLAIFEQAENVKQVSEACQERLELAPDALEIFSNPEDTEAFQVEEKATFTTALRNFFAADEVAREQEYKKALEDGHIVLQVRVDDTEKEQREKLEQILLENDATSVHYFGKLNFEDVASN